MPSFIFVNNGGGKPRFKILWPEGARRHLLHLEPLSAQWWTHVVEPLEIRCIQGGSGDRDIDESDTYWVPYWIKRVYHAGYLRDARSMLMGGGVFAGGHLGVKHRSRIYVSVADWVQWGDGYEAPKRPFKGFREEPYPPRGDWSMQVILCTESCRLAEGYFVQTESLAGAGPKNWHCPANCIEQINDREGCIIFRRPDSLESFNVWSARGESLRMKNFLNDIRNATVAVLRTLVA